MLDVMSKYVKNVTIAPGLPYPGRGAFVQEAFADATASPCGYLLIDLKQNTPDDMRLRTSILPDDTCQFVYVPNVFRKM